MAAAVVFLVTVPLVMAPGWAPRAAAEALDPDVQPTTPVPSQPLAKATAPVIPPEQKLPAAAWPAPGAAEVNLPETVDSTEGRALPGAKVAADAPAPSKVAGRVRAGTLPVWVGRPVSAPGAASRSASEADAELPSRVRVELLDRAVAEDLNVHGLLLRVDRADGDTTAGSTEVVVDYTAFRAAYGAGYGKRLRFVRYPACVLTTPKEPGCSVGTEVATRNDTANRQLVADLTVEPPGGAAPEPTPSTESTPSSSPSGSTSPSATPGAGGAGDAGGGSVFAVMASASSGGGSYAAQPLSAQAEWSTSGGAGDFTWSNPLRMPPSPTGLTPSLGLSYSSGVADGQTAASNNQATSAGLGFDLSTGFIERRYAACAYNGHNTGDLCWKYDNARLVLNGVATELLRKDDDEWFAKEDPGWRVRRVWGGGLPGRDDNDERWVVTTQDGTQYWFGLSWQPTTATPNHSVWTVPVYGLQSGDPCWTGTFATSHCEQAWRWNLDYVSDRNGNSVSYFYEEEGNYYGRGNDVYDQAYYIRGGNLIGVEYGTKNGSENATPPVEVGISLSGRCAGGADNCGSLTVPNAGNYPDVPMDQVCTNTVACLNHSPTFFSTKRISQVTTRVRNASGVLQAVDGYDFDTTFYGEADDPVDPALMLTGVTHQGLAGTTPIELAPGTWFQYTAMNNRVDVDTANGSPSIIRHRLAHVYDEYGSQLNVNYGQPAPCNVAALPSPTANSTNCFPAWWKPVNRPGEIGWFRKFLVTKVEEVDRTSLSPMRTTNYTYSGAAAWAHDDLGTIVPPTQQSWGQWRGYPKVLTTEGPTGGTLTRTENLYFRGLHGAQMVSVTNSRGGTNLDMNYLQGKVWETRSLDAAGVELAGVLRYYFVDKTWDGGGKDSWIVVPNEENNRVRLANGTYRYDKSTTQFENGTALPLKSIAWGEVNSAGADIASNDETCTATTYARNDSTYRHFPSVVETRSGTTCSAGDALLSRTHTFYDGHPNLTDAPSNGRPTKTRAYKNATEYVESTATFDSYGRVLSKSDPLGRVISTAYTPTDNRSTTKVVTTNAKGWTSEIMLAPWWGTPIQTKDVNGRITDIDYDALGRPTQVWLPGRPKTGPASQKYAYGVTPYTPNWAKTSTLHTISGAAVGTYLDAWAYFDGFGAELETQVSAPGGGRIVTANDFDARGLPAWTSMPFYNTAEPGTGAVNPLAADLSRTQTTYDVLERPTAVGFYTPTQSPKWTTTTSYGGDRSTVTPPVGGTKTTIVDTGGRTTSLIEQTDVGTTTTSYGYNRRGEMTSVTDALGNVSRYTYNLLGQRVTTDDPDAGLTTYDHDDAGQLTSTVDARNKKLTSTYDELGRKKAVYEGTVTGTKRAEWLYDTLSGGKGLLVSSAAYYGSNAYTKNVVGYDTAGRPTGTSVTIPAGEGNLTGTYAFGVTYDDAGRVATTTYPQAGGLGAETVTSIYNGLGGPATLTGVINGVSKPYVTATSFTQLGQLAKRYSGGGTAGEARRTYTYETDTGRLSTVVSKAGTALATVQDDRYTYDAIGNATRVAEHNAAGALAVAECFSYDKLNRLSQAFTTTAAACAANPAAGTANGIEPYHLSWTYNDIGNRITETNKLTALPVTRTSGYPTSGDGVDRPHAPTSVTTSGDPSPDTATYDAAGNTDVRTIDGLTGDFTWDVFGRLDHVDIQRSTGTEQTGYLYDADGNRLLRKEPGATTLYLGTTELKLTTAGAETGTVAATRFYTHGGAPVAVRTASGLTWILNDTQTSAEVAVDAVTGSTARRRYLPFGGDRTGGAVIAAWPSERGFLNQTKDASTGLAHLGAREYDAMNGRFLTPDPLSTPSAQQNTAYAYAANNPVTYSDPSGLSPEDAQFWVNKPASAEKKSRAANTTRYGTGRASKPKASGQAGDGMDWNKWTKPHDKAVELRMDDIRAKYGADKTVTSERIDNFIRGGSSKGNDKYAGYADIICWDCEEGVLLIWEVKHAGGPAEIAGTKQLERYIEKMQAMAKPGVRVKPGPAFDHSSAGPNPHDPRETVIVTSKVRVPGIELYTIVGPDDEPRVLPVPGRDKSGEKRPHIPTPEAQPRPSVPTARDIGVIATMVAGVLAVYAGTIIVGGFVLGGAAYQG